MTEALPPRPGRRILAAFYPATTRPNAINAAVDLAARLQAELQAMFIEHADLLHLAEFPFVRQVGVHGLIGRSLRRDAIESELRTFAAEAERHLAEAADRRCARWSFKTARGRIDGQIAAFAGTVDLLLLESSSRPIGRVVQLQTSVRTLARLAAGSFLMLHPTHPLAGPIHAVLESILEAARVTAAAAELARHFDGELVLHLVARDKEERAVLTDVIKDPILAGLNTVHAESMADLQADVLDSILAAVIGGTLVMSADCPLLVDEVSWKRIAKAPCSVLQVKSNAARLEAS